MIPQYLSQLSLLLFSQFLFHIVAVIGFAPTTHGLVPAALLLSYTASIINIYIYICFDFNLTAIYPATYGHSIVTEASRCCHRCSRMDARPVTAVTPHCLSSHCVFV